MHCLLLEFWCQIAQWYVVYSTVIISYLIISLWWKTCLGISDKTFVLINNENGDDFVQGFLNILNINVNSCIMTASKREKHISRWAIYVFPL